MFQCDFSGISNPFVLDQYRFGGVHEVDFQVHEVDLAQ